MTEKRPLSEEEALAIVLHNHPEWHQQWEDGTLPDTITRDDGEAMSPRLHIRPHVIVEQQLSANEPAGVVAVAEELEELGFPEHEIRHEFIGALMTQVWYMRKEGSKFDTGWYLAELRKIVEVHRRRGGV